MKYLLLAYLVIGVFQVQADELSTSENLCFKKATADWIEEGLNLSLEDAKKVCKGTKKLERALCFQKATSPISTYEGLGLSFEEALVRCIEGEE
jgi:hypothetical protein